MIRIAVVGYGYWGPNIVRNILAHPHTTVSWVCDINPTVLQTIKSVRTTTDIADVLTDSTTDAIVIVTPPVTHFDIARKALTAGKHVLIEKPMTQTTKQAMDLVTRAKKQKKTLMVDHTFLYTPAVTKLKEIIQKGTLGTIMYVDSVRTNLGLFQKESNVITDLAVHDFSIMEYVLGLRPHTVIASGMNNNNLGQETVAYLTVAYEKNLFAHFHVSWLSPVKIRRMIVVGTRKMAVYDDIEPSEKIRIYDKSVTVAHDLRVGYRSGNVVIPQLSSREALTGVIEDFVKAIKTGKQPRAHAMQGAMVVSAIEAANRSLHSNGKRVFIPRVGK